MGLFLAILIDLIISAVVGIAWADAISKTKPEDISAEMEKDNESEL